MAARKQRATAPVAGVTVPVRCGFQRSAALRLRNRYQRNRNPPTEAAPTYISMAMCRHAAPHSRHVAALRVSTASFLKASQA